MVKELIHDPIFLAGKSDTLIAHKDSCVGMAANMIGLRNASSLFLTRVNRRLHAQ